MSLGERAIKSTFILLIIGLLQRSIGLISIIILARLLTPEDYGVAAIATMVVFLFDILSESGAQQYLIHKKELCDEDIDTAWTLNLLLKGSLCLVFIILSPALATFFENDNLIEVFIVIAFILPVSALSNPGLILLKRNLNYKPIMSLLVGEKIFSVIITVLLAVVLRNYWAMIIGILSSYIYKSIGSFLIHSYRPKICLSKLKEQWSFSQWMILKGILGYSKSEFDTLLVSKFYGVEILGGYSLMRNLSTLPVRELVRPLTEPLLAVFSKSNNDLKRFTFQVNISMFILSSLTIPLAMYIWAYSDDIVLNFLGNKWLPFSSLLGLLTIMMLSFSVVSVLQQALTSIGKVKLIFFYDLITFIIIFSFLVAISFNDVTEFVAVRVLLVSLSAFCFCFVFNKATGIGLSRYLMLITPLIICASAALYITNQFFVSDLDLFSLIASGLMYLALLLVFVPLIYFPLRTTEEVRYCIDKFHHFFNLGMSKLKRNN